MRDDADAQSFGYRVIRDLMQTDAGSYFGWTMDITARHRAVVSIPFDHEMVDGHLRYGALAKRTQRAWLAAGASVARGF